MTPMSSPSSQTVPKQASTRHSQLVKEIRAHDLAYYERDAPSISDPEYDALLRELEQLELSHPALVTTDSPTQRVAGGPVSALQSVAHRRPMLSLANTYSRDEVLDWFGSVKDFLGEEAGEARFHIEPKLDGVAL